jgi:hypothetical protein
VESDQKSLVGLEIVFQFPRSTATVCVTPAVISGTGTIIGLGQTGLSATVADQTVPAMTNKWAARIGSNEGMMFLRGAFIG